MDERRSRRWDPYILTKGSELRRLWNERTDSSSKVLLIMGRGFDPRVCDGLELLSSVLDQEQIRILLVELDEGRGSPSQTYREQVERNMDRIRGRVDKEKIEEQVVEMVTRGGRRVGDRRAADVVDVGALSGDYTDVIVDTSAIPTYVYFPLLAKLLYLYDRSDDKDLPDIHVFVSENPEIDKLIIEEGVEDAADFVHGFRRQLETEATEDLPQIWFPLVGEAKGVQMERVYSRITPDEIAPVLPFPSGEARRGDDLVYEYRERFFDSFRVPPQNIIYADERNPFQVYRKVVNAIEQYNEALQPLGGCASVISVLSSKLMALGGFLAAYELDGQSGIHVGVAHVESRGYRVVGGLEDLPTEGSQLFSAWLAGDAYEQ